MLRGRARWGRRNRLPHLTLAALLTFAGLALAADFSTARFRKPIPLTPGPGLAAVKIDRELYIGAQRGLGDVRVVRDGEEIPYVIAALGAESQTREEAAEILDQSIAPGQGLQLTLHLSDAPRHNVVRIVTPEQNFRQAVRIETSENGRRWSIVRADGAIFDFTQGNRRLSSLSLDYPVSTRPYLRLTIRGWTKIDAVSSALVEFQEEQSPSRETLATLTPRVTEDRPTQSTIALLDLGAAGMPVDRMFVETPAAAFHRAVDIEASENGNDWRLVTQGVIERWSGHSFVTIDIPQTQERYIRLRIYNRDDRPIEVKSVRLDGLIRHLRFFAAQAGQYWLYYGASDARAPSYDLAAVLAREGDKEAVQWTAGPQEPNPAYRPPVPPERPWSERHPAILYTVLGAAILGLGVATLRFAMRLRQPPVSPPN
jgi:hypothetical protein